MRIPLQVLTALFSRRLALLLGTLLLAGMAFGNITAADATSSSIRISRPSDVQLSQLTMIDRKRGWALNQDGTLVLATSNGPEHWRSVTPKGLNLPPRDPRNSITATFFPDARHAYLGVLQNDKTYLYSTQDGGRTWNSTFFNIPILTNPVDIHQIYFLDARHGWIEFDRNHAQPGHFDILLMSTSDGGKTWQTLIDTSQNPASLPLPYSQSSHFSFVNAHQGWVTGISLSADVYLYATRDGGKTWQRANIAAVKGASFTLGYGPYWQNSRIGTLYVKYDPENGGAPLLTTYQTRVGG